MEEAIAPVQIGGQLAWGAKEMHVISTPLADRSDDPQ